MKKFVLSLMVAAIMAGCSVPMEDVSQNDLMLKKAGLGAVINVPGDFTTIKAAVANAVSGSRIIVQSGVYEEQVEIRNIDNLTLIGLDATIKVPQAGMTGTLLKLFNCQGFLIKGFTIDGNNGVDVTAGSFNTGGDTDTRFYGLFAINSSGQIVDNNIINVSWHNGVQQGIGMYVYVTDNVQRSVDIKGNTINNFNKGGVSVRGPINSKIMDNIVTHWCETGINAGNGIQVDGGRTLIQGNNVSCSRYFDETHQAWTATAVLLIAWKFPVEDFKVINNIISDSDIGIDIEDFGAGLGENKIINNKFSGNLSDVLGPDDMKVHANKYE